MNKKEWYSGAVNKTFKWKHLVQQKIKEWQISNNIAEKCDIHHRDDTEECRKYNEEHYELWGFNEDGTFEYGKYVVFMTHAEHSYYHHHGEKHHMYGRKGLDNPLFGHNCTEETKRKISESNAGRKRTDEMKYKMSLAAKNQYLSSDEFRERLHNAFKGKHHTDEAKAKMSRSIKEHFRIMSDAYKKYKLSGGTLMWNDFRKQYKNTPISQIYDLVEIINEGASNK